MHKDTKSSQQLSEDEIHEERCWKKRILHRVSKSGSNHLDVDDSVEVLRSIHDKSSNQKDNKKRSQFHNPGALTEENIFGDPAKTDGKLAYIISESVNGSKPYILPTYIDPRSLSFDNSGCISGRRRTTDDDELDKDKNHFSNYFLSKYGESSYTEKDTNINPTFLRWSETPLSNIKEIASNQSSCMAPEVKLNCIKTQDDEISTQKQSLSSSKKKLTKECEAHSFRSSSNNSKLMSLDLKKFTYTDCKKSHSFLSLEIDDPLNLGEIILQTFVGTTQPIIDQELLEAEFANLTSNQVKMLKKELSILAQIFQGWVYPCIEYWKEYNVSGRISLLRQIKDIIYTHGELQANEYLLLDETYKDDIEELMLQRRLLGNRKNSDGDTLLHLIVLCGHLPLCKEIAKKMIESGDDLSKFNDQIQTPLHLSIACLNDDIAVCLAKLQPSTLADTQIIGNNAIHLAVLYAQHDDTELIALQTLISLSSKETLDSINFEGFAPIHIAVKYNKDRVIAILVAGGADINRREARGGATAFILATREKKNKIVQTLLLLGASRYYRSSYGEMAGQSNSIRCQRGSPSSDMNDDSDIDIPSNNSLRRNMNDIKMMYSCENSTNINAPTIGYRPSKIPSAKLDQTDETRSDCHDNNTCSSNGRRRHPTRSPSPYSRYDCSSKLIKEWPSVIPTTNSRLYSSSSHPQTKSLKLSGSEGFCDTAVNLSSRQCSTDFVSYTPCTSSSTYKISENVDLNNIETDSDLQAVAPFVSVNLKNISAKKFSESSERIPYRRASAPAFDISLFSDSSSSAKSVKSFTNLPTRVSSSALVINNTKRSISSSSGYSKYRRQLDLQSYSACLPPQHQDLLRRSGNLRPSPNDFRRIKSKTAASSSVNVDDQITEEYEQSTAGNSSPSSSNPHTCENNQIEKMRRVHDFISGYSAAVRMAHQVGATHDKKECLCLNDEDKKVSPRDFNMPFFNTSKMNRYKTADNFSTPHAVFSQRKRNNNNFYSSISPWIPGITSLRDRPSESSQEAHNMRVPINRTETYQTDFPVRSTVDFRQPPDVFLVSSMDRIDKKASLSDSTVSSSAAVNLSLNKEHFEANLQTRQSLYETNAIASSPSDSTSDQVSISLHSIYRPLAKYPSPIYSNKSSVSGHQKHKTEDFRKSRQQSDDNHETIQPINLATRNYSSDETELKVDGLNDGDSLIERQDAFKSTSKYSRHDFQTQNAISKAGAPPGTILNPEQKVCYLPYPASGTTSSLNSNLNLRVDTNQSIANYIYPTYDQTLTKLQIQHLQSLQQQQQRMRRIQQTQQQMMRFHQQQQHVQHPRYKSQRNSGDLTYNKVQTPSSPSSNPPSSYSQTSQLPNPTQGHPSRQSIRSSSIINPVPSSTTILNNKQKLIRQNNEQRPAFGGEISNASNRILALNASSKQPNRKMQPVSELLARLRGVSKDEITRMNAIPNAGKRARRMHNIVHMPSISLPRGNSANQQAFSRIDQDHLRFVYSQQQQQDERPLHLLTANSYSEDTLQNNSLSLTCGTFSNRRRRQEALKSDTIYPESAEPLLKVSRR